MSETEPHGMVEYPRILEDHIRDARQQLRFERELLKRRKWKQARKYRGRAREALKGAFYWKIALVEDFDHLFGKFLQMERSMNAWVR